MVRQLYVSRRTGPTSHRSLRFHGNVELDKIPNLIKKSTNSFPVVSTLGFLALVSILSRADINLSVLQLTFRQNHIQTKQ